MVHPTLLHRDIEDGVGVPSKSAGINNLQSLLDPALVPPLDEKLASLVLGQKLQLFSIDGSSTLLSDHLHGILVLHPELDESRGHQHRSSAQPGHTVDSNAGVRVGLELPIDEAQPLVHDLLCRGGPVREAQLGHGDLLLLQLLRVVELVSGAHEVGDLVLLQQSDVVVHSPVLWLVGDEEAHVPAEVPVLDLGGGRTNDLTSHLDALLPCFWWRRLMGTE